MKGVHHAVCAQLAHRTVAVAVGDGYRGDPGRARIFELAGATPGTPTATIPDPYPSRGVFGESVAIAGKRVVVSYINDTTGDSGA